ncbi:hypothetical protein EUBVEN_01025 [Eubacterium ventriosum ATCC 27560]|uniref:Uncharacterized protein n=1 Tax=Eubacterium ventriosum ATCC 27560 TaxID=411463 RepID=A5Z5P3_9FIRM|nr:hypothetical protein EUBVEN_01025 [Eubacterium ventriosum ATCC 27560]
MNHVNSCLVSSTFKLCSKKFIKNHFCKFYSNNSCAKSNNISIVMLLCKFCRIRFAANCCNYTWNLVCCNRNTDSGSTHKYTVIYIFSYNCFTNFTTLVWIIALNNFSVFIIACAIINTFVALFCHIFNKFIL